tara:strand:- start:5686 stop:6105 length:420 start_codon:yes stop_codon:yes gene_type:complete
MKRLENWRARLSDEMDRQRLTPFAWGGHDCGLGFAGGIVLALTGEDVAEPYRGRYTTMIGAARLLKSEGCDTVGDMLAKHFREIDPAQASVGDLGIVGTPDALGQGICMVDASSLVVMTESGHGRKARSEMIRAFRVGE